MWRLAREAIERMKREPKPTLKQQIDAAVDFICDTRVGGP
jgi:hypothetical protein